MDFQSVCAGALASAQASLARHDVAGATLQGIALVRQVDAYINATEPFKVAKKLEAEPALKDRLGQILYHCAETLRIASLLLSPAMPTKMAQLWQTWSCAPAPGAALSQLGVFAGAHALVPGQPLTKGEVLFMRADVAEPAPA
jgi:methionyl-tRNA synthetase